MMLLMQNHSKIINFYICIRISCCRPLLKVGLGGGALYFIAKEGVFSNSQKETLEAYRRIADSVPGDLNPYLEKVPKLISKEEMISYWNSGVKISISALASLPEDSKEALKKGYYYLQDELKKQIQQTSEKK